MLRVVLVLFVGLAGCSNSATSSHSDFSFFGRAGDKAARSNVSTVPRRAAAPKAFAGFCARYPSQCQSRGSRNTVVEASDWRIDQLRTVNDRVNRSIKERTDRSIYGRSDVWRIVGDGGYGDCEDFVLTKRSQLLSLGWPSSSLLVATTRTAAGQPHAVLLARTDRGTYVLDNRVKVVLKKAYTPYRYYAMQSTNNPARWVSVR